MQGIDTETLCRLAGVSRSQLSVWLTRGSDLDRPEGRGRRPLQWDLAQAFQIVLFARALAKNLSTHQAAADVHSQVTAIGRLIAEINRGGQTTAERAILVDATLVGGCRWQRLITSDADLERLLQAMLRRGIVRLELDDITAVYMQIMAAFRDARAEPARRERVLA